MGSSLFPNYTLEKSPYLKLRYWQIFRGVHKTSGDKVSVFIFEKKDIDKKTENEKKTILNVLKKEPENLLKIKNDKNILKIIEPLAEDSYNIGFITEYINYNLKEWVKEYHPNIFEIKYIIFQIISIIITLHNEYQISINSLNPENIFITENNIIKISELNLSTSLNDAKNNNNSLNQLYQETFIDLKYCFPELIFDNNINQSSDNYLIGLISYYLLKNENEDLFILLDNTVNSFKSTYKNTNMDKKIKKFNNDNTEEFLKNLLDKNPDRRKSLSLIQNSKFFIEPEDNNKKLITLCLLSKMDSLELSKSYELLKNLPNILNLYSNKEKEFLILPNLLYFLKKENLINPIIPSIFLLCEQGKSEINFSKKIWPNFKFLFNMKKLPAAALYYILKNISFFLQKLEKQEFNKYCIPLICKALDCGVQKIQEVILEEMPKILNDLDKNEFQNTIYNRLINIGLQTKNQKLKTNIMNFLLYLCDYFDSYFINYKFLDDIDKIVKGEMTIINCKNAFNLYEKLESKANDKSVRSKIIPCLLSMMSCGEISEELFNKGEKIINEYIKKMKEKRKDQFVKEVFEINIPDNYSDEIKENVVSSNYSNNLGSNLKNINNEIGTNSPLSVSKTKSTLSGNISLLDYNSSEDSELKMKKSKKKATEKKENINNNINYNNNYNKINDNLFDALLADDNNDKEGGNASFDSGLVEDKNQSKNILKFVDKKEFLSSLELKRIEAKKNQMENNINNINNNCNKKNISNLWEEIDGDDENNNNNNEQNLNAFIKKKKKSGSIKEKEKEKNVNNKLEKNEKINEKIKGNKKWDEDEEEDNNDLMNDLIENKEKEENKIENNDNNFNKEIKNNDSENVIKSNNTENKDTTDVNKNNSSNKKKIKKKKKKKKEKNLEEKINNVEKHEKDEEKMVSTTKMNMEKRAASINLEDLLGD